MLSFTPPSGFKDVSDYRFRADGRRMAVRFTRELGANEDLKMVATDYANAIQEYLGASNVVVSPVVDRADHGAYVTVVGTLDKEKSVERSAFVRLPNGTSMHVSLISGADDRQAEAEFLPMVLTVHAAPPMKAGERRTMATQNDNPPPQHRVGPALFTLSSDYRNHSVFKFENDAGTRLTLKYEEGDAVTAPMDARGALGPRIKGIDDRGQPFAYEQGEDPWRERLTRIARAHPERAQQSSTTKSIDIAPGKRVIVRVQGPTGDAALANLADQTIQSVSVQSQSAVQTQP